MCRCCKVPSVKPLHHLLIPVWVRLFIPGVWAETAAVSESLWWDLLQASAEKSHSTCNLTQRSGLVPPFERLRTPCDGPLWQDLMNRSLPIGFRLSCVEGVEELINTSEGGFSVFRQDTLLPLCIFFVLILQGKLSAPLITSSVWHFELFSYLISTMSQWKWDGS